MNKELIILILIFYDITEVDFRFSCDTKYNFWCVNTQMTIYYIIFALPGIKYNFAISISN